MALPSLPTRSAFFGPTVTVRRSSQSGPTWSPDVARGAALGGPGLADGSARTPAATRPAEAPRNRRRLACVGSCGMRKSPGVAAIVLAGGGRGTVAASGGGAFLFTPLAPTTPL